MATKEQRQYNRQEDQKSLRTDNRDAYKKIMTEESSDLWKQGAKNRDQQRSSQQQFARTSSQPKEQSPRGISQDIQKKHYQGRAIYDVQHNTATCYNHGKIFSSYCETCEEPCCEDCKNYGHRVININYAYRKRMSQIYNMMNTHLYQKKEILVQQLRKRDQIIEQIRGTTLSIERELRAEFASMIERLNATSGQKLALLQYDKDELQADINKVKEIASQIDSSQADHLQFLVRSKGIIENIEKALAKPYRADIQVTTEDLPKELSHTRELVTQCQIYKELNASKDELI